MEKSGVEGIAKHIALCGILAVVGTTVLFGGVQADKALMATRSPQMASAYVGTVNSCKIYTVVVRNYVAIDVRKLVAICENNTTATLINN